MAVNNPDTFTCLVDEVGTIYDLPELLGVIASGVSSADSVDVASGTADVQGAEPTPGLRLMGFSARESAIVPVTAELILRNGEDVNASPVIFQQLTGIESATYWFGPGGIDFSGGIFVERVSGTSHVVLFTKVVT